MVQYIEAKSILSKLKSKDPYFGLTYNMNLYRGCQHGCIYCDTRSDCYGIGDISTISAKKNALELLNKELASKKIRATVGTGSMNDPYMPIEKKLGITRDALKTLDYHKFPVHIITKGSLVERDYDILQNISKIYAAVSFTITSADDVLARKIEPHAPSSSQRFAALEFLAKKGIYTGITLMPILPFINDTKENIELILKRAKDAGAAYIIPMFGVTLRKGSRDYFYNALDKQFPDIKLNYQNIFGEQYECMSPNYRILQDTFCELSEKLDIPSGINFYEPSTNQQLSIF
ncbi:MAG: radical SAM protein [Dysgonomonas sp.]|nr:radical SAM protein [Dysgonomonas sp.]